MTNTIHKALGQPAQCRGRIGLMTNTIHKASGELKQYFGRIGLMAYKTAKLQASLHSVVVE